MLYGEREKVKPYKRLQSQGHVERKKEEEKVYWCSKFLMLIACLVVEIIQR